MDIEEIRNYCLSEPEATEDFPFDETTLVFRVHNKIFALIDLEDTEWFCLKCDPDYALELRDRFTAIRPAWHMNKKYWNQIDYRGDVSDEEVRHLVDHSWSEVVKKLPKYQQDELKEKYGK